MLTFYLVRHGETEWNKAHKLQGRKDSPLTDKGIEHAQLLGTRLSNIEFHAIYSSPIKRAFQTAEYIRSGRNIPILTDENLKEINFGEWEGRKREELEQKYKNQFSNFWDNPHKYDHKLNKGESLTAFKQRIEAALKRILVENSSGNILVVSHGVVIKGVLSYIMNFPTEKIWNHPYIHNTSLTIFHWNGQGFQIDMVGDTSHFEKDSPF